MKFTRREYQGQRGGRRRSGGADQPPRPGHPICGSRGHSTQVVQGALPLLRHWLRGDGRGQGQPGGRDPRRHQAEVNRGLNCVKGYFLSKIMYGDDRLTTPLLRMRTASTIRTASSNPCPGTRRST